MLILPRPVWAEVMLFPRLDHSAPPNSVPVHPHAFRLHFTFEV